MDEGVVVMIIKGVTIHNTCGGTGIIETHKDGTADICVGCMGSGLEEVEIELD